MSTSMQLACPHCDAINRVPAERLADAPGCGRCHRALFTRQPVTLTPDNIDAFTTRSQLPTLVDFWAPWCGPCLSMAPHFERAAAVLEPHVRLAKVDTQAHQALGQRFDIRSIPTLVLFVAGRERARHSGAMGQGAIVDWARQQLV